VITLTAGNDTVDVAKIAETNKTGVLEVMKFKAVPVDSANGQEIKLVYVA